jgi:hypothetical protein
MEKLYLPRHHQSLGTGKQPACGCQVRPHPEVTCQYVCLAPDGTPCDKTQPRGVLGYLSCRTPVGLPISPVPAIYSNSRSKVATPGTRGTDFLSLIAGQNQKEPLIATSTSDWVKIESCILFIATGRSNQHIKIHSSTKKKLFAFFLRAAQRAIYVSRFFILRLG